MAPKTVAILGASYGGARAAHLLAQGLPAGWRVVLVDRNTHLNHLYVLPRYAVLPGHEHKAFIPYNNVFRPPRPFDASDLSPPPSPANPQSQSAQSPHVFLHAAVTSLSHRSLTLDRAYPAHGVTEADRALHFDYLVYALGSHLPAPIDLWGPVADEDVEKASVLDVSRGTKEGGIAWLKRFQKRVERASSVLVVGGGALGIQFAADIAEVHPTTSVTLLHSRSRLLPRFDEGMHSEIVSSLTALNVCTILGDRLDLTSLQDKQSHGRERVVRTQSGREIRAELVLLCTGQTPNTSLLLDAFPNSVIAEPGPDRGLARVRRTMQLAEPVPASELSPSLAALSLADTAVPSPTPSESSSPASSEPSSPAESDEDEDAPAPVVEEDAWTRVAAERVFAIGDAADAFGAINAGHNAFFQGEVAARNILKLVARDEAAAARRENDDNVPEPELEKYAPGQPAIKVSLGLTKSVYQFQGVIGTRDAEQADLDVHLIWRYFGYQVERADLESGAFSEPAPVPALAAEPAPKPALSSEPESVPESVLESVTGHLTERLAEAAVAVSA